MPCGSLAGHSIPHSVLPHRNQLRSNRVRIVFTSRTAMSLSGRGRGHSRSFVAADLDRAQNPGRPHPRTPIMQRLHADCGDNPDPDIQCQAMSHQNKKPLTSSARLDNKAKSRSCWHAVGKNPTRNNGNVRQFNMMLAFRDGFGGFFADGGRLAPSTDRCSVSR